MKSLLILTLILFIIILVFVSNSDSPPEYAKTEKPTLAYQLATINKGYVSDDDITITRFDYLLNELSSKIINTRQQIADMSVAGVQLLRDKYGVSYSLLDFMEGTNNLIDEGSDADYAKVATYYVSLVR